MATEQVAARQGTRLGEVLSLLFFVSGIPALIYQLIWERALFRIYASTSKCVTDNMSGEWRDNVGMDR